MNLTKLQIVKHLINHGDSICEQITDPSPYILGDIVSIGAVLAEIVEVYFNENSEPPQGHVTYRIMAEVVLNCYG